MRSFYFSRLGARFLPGLTLAASLWSLPVGAQTPPPVPSGFTVFLRSVPIGREQIDVLRTAEGWTISSTGQFNPPLDIVIQTVRTRYDSNWNPIELQVDATVRGQASLLKTTIAESRATSVLTRLNGTPSEFTESIPAGAILMPNPFVSPYEALSARLRTAAAGSSVPLYQPGGGSYLAEVGESSSEMIKTIDRVIQARRTRLNFRLPNQPPLPLEVWGDENGRLLRVSIPAQGLEFAREDIASVSTRIVTSIRPNDQDVLIPSTGFSIAGTVSRPAAATGPLPAVVLVAGTGSSDRDETIAGVSIFGQLANTLADAGYLVLRYDKRGSGQSGGRVESARLTEFAEDAKAAVKFVSDRKDVDRKRLTVLGYGEGGWIAMLAAAKNGRVAALGLLGTAGTSGREFNLAQVERGLDRSTRSAAEKQATIDLQKKIQEAVVTGKGWDSPELTPQIRRQADTPYFQSFLSFDPAKVMKDVKQPILVLQGAVDTEAPPANADALETLARARKNATPVSVVKVAGINHLLVRATTGDVAEYQTLTERTLHPDATTAILNWLKEVNQPRSR